MSDTLLPQEIAEKSAEAMLANDAATKHLGMEILSIAPGQATITMTVEKTMTNGHDTCHGGFIFTLADSAFAFACNSYNQNAVAQHCSVSYLAPGFEGDVLTATAKENVVSGRSGIYDIRVENQKGQHIAEFRGHSRTIKGTHF